MKAGLVSASLLYPLLLWLVVGRLAVAGWRGGLPSLPGGLLAALSWGLAVIAAANLATPWLRRKRWEAEELAAAFRSGALRPLLLGLPFVAAPASYGLLLYFLGLPVASVNLFLAASFLAAAAWGAAELRAKRGP